MLDACCPGLGPVLDAIDSSFKLATNYIIVASILLNHSGSCRTVLHICAGTSTVHILYICILGHRVLSLY